MVKKVVGSETVLTTPGDGARRRIHGEPEAADPDPGRRVSPDHCPGEDLAGDRSVPTHRNGDGLPIGAMLGGRYGEEALILSLAGQLETRQ